jgi:hypothetical protein
VSIYLTWMPYDRWDVSIFFAGFIEGICQCSGLECKVSSSYKLELSENAVTEYQIQISEAEVQRWKEME